MALPYGLHFAACDADVMVINAEVILDHAEDGGHDLMTADG